MVPQSSPNYIVPQEPRKLNLLHEEITLLGACFMICFIPYFRTCLMAVKQTYHDRIAAAKLRIESESP